MRDREANLTNRDREVPSGVRGRDRPLKELRSIPDADGSRADGAIGSESQVHTFTHEGTVMNTLCTSELENGFDHTMSFVRVGLSI